MARDQEIGTAQTRESIAVPAIEPSPTHQHAARFFWGVLAFGTVTSISGNVAHAILHAQGESRLMLCVAAAVALIPPAVLLLATHSVSLLVRTRSSGWVYWVAVAITVALAAFAFRLSFDALKELAIGTGVRDGIAWLWPLSVDLTIAQATVALLSLSRPRAERQPLKNTSQTTPAAAETAVVEPRLPEKSAVSRAGNPPRTPAAAPREPQRLERSNVQDITSFHRHEAHDELRVSLTEPAAPAAPGEAAGAGWEELAKTLIQDKVTVKPVEDVVEVLSLWDEKVPTTTIAARTGVHRDTVHKIIKAAEVLLSGASRLRA